MKQNQKNHTTIFAMQNSLKLGKKIAQKLEMSLSKIKKIRFADGEVLLKAEDTVRNKDVFVVASTSYPVNKTIMELLIFIDSLKRASAKSITIALSYYGYARQDRKAAGRQPITAKLVASLLETAGATKIIAIDLHNPSIQGFFNIPLDDLRGQYIFAPIIKEFGDFKVVSPDHGGATRAQLLAEVLGNETEIAIIDKRRKGTNKSITFGVLGDVKDKNIVIVDDMIDTGGTIIKAVKAIKERGAKRVIVAATHGIFSKGFKQFSECKDIERVIVTDSIETTYHIKDPKIQIISLDDLYVQAIEATINSTSISKIYNDIKNSIHTLKSS